MKKKIFPLKLTDEDRELIQKKANKFTQGKITPWLVYAAKNCKPPKSPIVLERNYKNKPKKK